MTTETYDIISENKESTVVAHYERPDTAREDSFQSESELESELIAQLQRQGYEYVDIHCEEELILNLRQQLQRLNNCQFTDAEWQRFFRQEIAAEGKGIEDRTQTIQQDHVKAFTLDSGEQRNICLINKKDIHANSTQVINQYVPEGGAHDNRYDVTILVNGLPLVHIELKRRGKSIREAFNQINRYGRDSFWAGNGLFEYVQLFVISNGTQTKYYSNTTRMGHVKEQAKTGKKPKVKTSNSFEFTSYWADATNKVINDLTDFTATFFSRHTLLNVLTRFCVFTEQKMLMAMRPYQIAATEKLLQRIEIAHNAKTYGSVDAGGYVWHTTGSGKTLTSFKAALLASQLDYVHKVIFVVDRKDLDYQTMREYDRFQKGAANGNTSTRELERQLANASSRIIITTIQKLSQFVHKNPKHDIYTREVVMIFDECHRSQFGAMHTAICRRFRKYYIFGFTGTPIFAENQAPGGAIVRTTEDVFGRRLHTYTIVDAIRDHNVLPFRVDYVSTMKEKEDIQDGKVWGIEQDKALAAPERIANVTAYILRNFDLQTRRTSSYAFNRLTNVAEVVQAKGANAATVSEQRQRVKLNGFNSILAVQSIEYAKLYYNEFKRQMQDLPPNRRLKVATIFSYAVNEEVQDGTDEENSDSTDALDQGSRDFLDMAIQDYNAMFQTSYDTSADKFPNYYKDISQRMKNRDLDLLIVVNMFLTGFDATTLNTLWVDKNLRYHGLLQSFSRTNRILNSVKVVGNIVCFRNLEDATNKTLSLFGDADAHSTTVLRPFEDYFNGFTDENGKWQKGYTEMVDELTQRFQPGEMPLTDKEQRDFVRLFGVILRMENLLSNFEQFTHRNPLPERDMQDYRSVYISLAEKWQHKQQVDKVNVNDDIEFEMELVKQVEVNIDYILYLVSHYHEGHGKDKEIRIKIFKAIDSSPDLRDKRTLISAFIDSLTPDSNVYEDWRTYVNQQKVQEYDTIIKEENLRPQKAIDFITRAFVRGYVPEGGLDLNDIMPPINPFDPKANREGKVQRVLQRIKAFFAKFYDVSNGNFSPS